jgi:UDP-N-acetylmuramoyl-L-alanyl-D-glutamate--2,6-diaminopimelate ligase
MTQGREITLDALLARTEGSGPWRVVGDPGAIVSSITHDSHRVEAHGVFCCVPGLRYDGHSFAADAVAAGASVLLVDHELAISGATQVVVPDVRAAMAPLAAEIAGHPSLRLEVIGVTGTNGKTTTVSLLADIFRHVGRSTAVIGTLTGARTTPEAPDLQARLAHFADDGVTTVAMEVSSHALALHRVDGCHFVAGLFTNLGRDHLDLHGTMEGYFAAKARLFEPGRCKIAVLNVDDPYGRRLARSISVPTVEYSVQSLEDVEVHPDRHRYRWRGHWVEVPLGARFNVANSLAAATTAAALGVSERDVVDALRVPTPVPGRFETVVAGQPFFVVVDYAHTPDGLHAVIDAARDAADGGRVIVVFGCGGDRDRDKRPLMGQVVAERADLAVVTSDNPRSEDPRAIIDDVLSGVSPEYRANALVEPDRETAIGVAFRVARPGDVVVLAGKGHETTQTIGSDVLPFDDRVVARRVLEFLP